MIHSDSIGELATALAKAQGELAGAKKDVNNPFFNKKYADLASIVEALKACFPKHGLSYAQTICTNEHGVGVETILLHSSGEWIQGAPFFLPVNKADAQGFGSCATYARRYSLAAIAGVAPEDDDGNAAAAASPKTPVQRVAALDNKVLPRNIPANLEGEELYKALPEDARAIVDEKADECRALVRGGDLDGALEVAREFCKDHEDELIMAHRLDSTTRNKMKERKAAHRALAQGPALASQA